MKIQHFYDERTNTLTYLVSDEATHTAILIDPVHDFEPKAARTSTESADTVAAAIDAADFKLAYVMDTHPHADHFSAMPYFKERYGAQTVIGAGIKGVQATFRDMFNLASEIPADGSQFDILLQDGDTLDAGGLHVEAIATPGHTPGSFSYKIGDAVFVGDLVFQPDSGTARCDFPGGSAAEEYDSIKRLYELPPETRLFTGHDYQPGGRELQFCATVREHAETNKHLRSDTTKEEFVALRARVEEGKPAPNLLFQALQVNIRGGLLPEAEDNGTSYLKIPLNRI